MRQSSIALEKYWATHSGYFRLTNTVELCVGIIDGKLLFYHGISEGSVDKKISTIEYNNRMLYDCFNNTFPDDCGSPVLNIPPIIIDGRPHQDKRARYSPDLLPAAIYVASENHVSTLTIPSDPPQVLVLTSDDPNHRHAMKKD